MVNYGLGKIYKIVGNGLTFVGSTCEPTLARRLAGHVAHFKLFLNNKYHYVTSFEVLEGGDYDIVLLEKYPCNTKDELHARERYRTNQIDCVNRNKGQLCLMSWVQRHIVGSITMVIRK